jgi:hypothetical protein
MAVSLESKDHRDAYCAGAYPSTGWEVEAEAAASRSTDELYRAVWSSFIAVLLVALLSIALVSLAGLIATNLPIAIGKVTSAIGGFLAGWATLFALGTPARTWKAKSLPELVHPRIFSLLFLAGLFFAFLGQLW